ncbi:MAG: hypothetical protein PHO46_06745 [Thermoguttaceae bacterium]|jgi:hypothetical protein|nr:hypothetical protein [Thermoguttaceae bacterium]
MEMYDSNIHDYLIFNGNPKLNNGAGFFIKKGTSKEKIEEIREYHNESLQRGKPYFIMDFLLEDVGNGIEVERRDGGFHRKKKE